MPVYGLTFFVTASDDQQALTKAQELRDALPAGDRFIVSVDYFANRDPARLEELVTSDIGVGPHHHVGGLKASK